MLLFVQLLSSLERFEFGSGFVIFVYGNPAIEQDYESTNRIQIMKTILIAEDEAKKLMPLLGALQGKYKVIVALDIFQLEQACRNPEVFDYVVLDGQLSVDHLNTGHIPRELRGAGFNGLIIANSATHNKQLQSGDFDVVATTDPNKAPAEVLQFIRNHSLAFVREPVRELLLWLDTDAEWPEKSLLIRSIPIEQLSDQELQLLASPESEVHPDFKRKIGFNILMLRQQMRKNPNMKFKEDVTLGETAQRLLALFACQE